MTDEFTAFVHGEGIDNVHLLLTVMKEAFKSMGFDIDFKHFGVHKV